jgi:hypothetical protein
MTKPLSMLAALPKGVLRIERWACELLEAHPQKEISVFDISFPISPSRALFFF